MDLSSTARNSRHRKDFSLALCARILDQSSAAVAQAHIHTRMQEPLTCVGELEELALAMESEVLESYSEVLASLESAVLRRSPGFSPPQRAAVITHVACQGWALVMKTRKEKGGATASSNLKDVAATSRALKVDAATSAVNTVQRDGDAKGAAKARGDWALSQLAAKGRGDQLGQGGRLDDKAVSKPAASVSVGRGRRELPTGTGQPAAANTSRPGGAHAWGVAKGGDAGGRQLAAKGRGDQHRQGDKLAGTGAGKRLASFVDGGGRRGPSAGAGRPAATNPPRLGARAGRSGGLAAWGPAPALSNGVAPRVPHLTGSGRLRMARKRQLFLRCGGQLGRRGRRS